MMTKLKTKTNKKGFTLVELIMVVALIAILAAIAVPTVTNVIKTANENVDKSNAQTVELAIKTSYSELVSETWKPTKDDGTKLLPADLTVGDALKHAGIDPKTITESKSGANWIFSGGKIYCESGKTGTALTSGIKVEAATAVS